MSVYSQSISVYIVHPSKDLKVQAQVSWDPHAPCIILRLSVNDRIPRLIWRYRSPLSITFNKQCTSLAYQVLRIQASAFPCCSRGNRVRSVFGSRNGYLAPNIHYEVNFCRKVEGFCLWLSLASKYHLILFNSIMATVYYVLLGALAISKSGHKKFNYICILFWNTMTICCFKYCMQPHLNHIH